MCLCSIRSLERDNSYFLCFSIVDPLQGVETQVQSTQVVYVIPSSQVEYELIYVQISIPRCALSDLNAECLQSRWELRLTSLCHAASGWYQMQQWRKLSPHSNISQLKIGNFLSWNLSYELLNNNLYMYASLEAHIFGFDGIYSENIQLQLLYGMVWAVSM